MSESQTVDGSRPRVGQRQIARRAARPRITAGGASPVLTVFFARMPTAWRLEPEIRADGTLVITLGARFIELATFDLTDPPAATVIVEPEPGAAEIRLLRLSNLRYDPLGHLVTYDARLVARDEDIP